MHVRCNQYLTPEVCCCFWWGMGVIARPVLFNKMLVGYIIIMNKSRFFRAFVCYAKIIYIHVRLLFPKISSTYVMIFQFVKDLSLTSCWVGLFLYLFVVEWILAGSCYPLQFSVHCIRTSTRRLFNLFITLFIWVVFTRPDRRCRTSSAVFDWFL